MRALAISGSLRERSSNSALLRALAGLATADFEVSFYEGLSQIPPFNPDLDDSSEHSPVNALRAAIRKSDVVIFSAPEYAHGIPGLLKNALDWIVSSGELSRKRVVLLNASARGVFAQAALREVLKTMDAIFLASAETTIEMAQISDLGPHLLDFIQKLSANDTFLEDAGTIDS